MPRYDGLSIATPERHAAERDLDCGPSSANLMASRMVVRVQHVFVKWGKLLPMANGSEVYAGEYLPCEDRSPLAVSKIDLVPPPDQVGMWIADKRLKELAPIGALRKGDLLVPVAVLDRCDELKAKHRDN